MSAPINAGFTAEEPPDAPPASPPMPDMAAILRETMGSAREIAKANARRRPPESFFLLLGGAVGATVAGLVPGVGDVRRAAAIGAGAVVAGLVSAARHNKGA